jgi:hypothetical protein
VGGEFTKAVVVARAKDFFFLFKCHVGEKLDINWFFVVSISNLFLFLFFFSYDFCKQEKKKKKIGFLVILIKL